MPPTAMLRPHQAHQAPASYSRVAQLAAAASKGGNAGPVGANGARPQLAWPTTAVAGGGTSTAGKPQGATGGGAAAAAAGGGKRTAEVDDEGFIAVRARGKTRRTEESSVGGCDRTVGDDGGHGHSTREENIDADADMGTQADDGGGHGKDEEATGEQRAEGTGGEGVDEPVDPDALRARWEREKELLELVRRQDREADDPIVQDAERRCAQAKADWEAAKGPPRMSRKLGKAEAAVQKARARQAAAEQDLDDLDREYEAKRAAYVDELAEARRVTKQREAELLELQRTVGGGAAAAGDGAESTIVKEMARRIDGLAPMLQALLESLPTGTEAHSQVATTVAELAGVAGVAAKAAQDTRFGAQRYHIGGGDNNNDDGDARGMGEESDFEDTTGWGAADDGWPNGAPTRRWSHHYQGHQGGGASWADSAGWYYGGGWNGGDGAQSASAGGADQLEGRAEIRTGNADAWANEEERARAQQAYAAQLAAQQAGFANEEATAAAAGVHAALLAEIKRKAEGKGVAYADAGLDEMPTVELEAWAKANIEQAH